MRPAEFQQAVDACRARLHRDPRDVEALNSLGNLLANAGHLDASQAAYERAAAVRPDLPQLHFNLGNLFQRRGRYQEARACFGKALELQPDYPDAWNNLGNALQDLAELDGALDAYRRAIELRSDFPEPHNNLGLALRKLDRHADAVEAFERALAINPGYAAAIVNRGLALRSLERYAESLRDFDRALELTPNAAAVWCFKGAALMESGDARGAREALDRSLALEPFNRTALAYRMSVMPELDDQPEPQILRDLDRHVASHEVTCPPEFDTLVAFNEALARHVRTHPSLSEQAAGRATRHGAHTGNLLAGEKGPVEVLERSIVECVRRYFAEPPMHPAHPYARFAVPQWRLVSWAVVMSTGGHQIPHIHAAGWLSGVYYVRLPACVGESAGDQAGWIEFGRPPDSLNCRAEPVTRRVCPREGRLLVFPSYYYHRTIPFESGEPRISIAFDVIPAAPITPADHS